MLENMDESEEIFIRLTKFNQWANGHDMEASMSDRFAEKPFENPYRPGAGHPPPYLAGRNSNYRR